MTNDRYGMVVFAGGKTGGHLFPGIAVADILRERGVPVRFIGSRGGLEERELPARGFELDFITVGGLKGKNLFETIRNIAILPFALARSILLLVRHRVALVVSLGGFAAGPVALAAKLSGRAVLVMEQNSIPGITNRIVGRFADRIFLSFPDTRGMFDPRRTALTGNPVRRDILTGETAKPDTALPVLGVFGGSQGAASLNALLLRLVADHPAVAQRFFIVHQTGERDLSAVRDRYATAGVASFVTPFLRDIGNYYRAADIIVCRAGATTIAELAALKKAAIYVPFPHAADDHQYHNARWVTEQGGGLLIRDAGPEEERGSLLAAALTDILRDLPAWRSKMEKITLPDAARAVADAIMAHPAAGGAR